MPHANAPLSVEGRRRLPGSVQRCSAPAQHAGFDREGVEADQTATPVAAEIQNLLLDARLARRLRTILDSTNVMGHVRAGLLARARYWQRPTSAVLFDIPLATVEAQNASRDRVVPLHVVRELHELTPSREQLLAEGFDTVHLASELATAGAGR
ncbi:AAA family ATPase [Streptomyces afghaniensis]|uniref:AAA family ATPase n=1 Tax=Streptomyces afghaniensis TaxID=66865 RepID=UPI00277DE566|nr:AAA family ATPase [Streptomyces afghaniensis]MDQ1022358.1 putative kinase [Streptomyces afghaniensis]